MNKLRLAANYDLSNYCRPLRRLGDFGASLVPGLADSPRATHLHPLRGLRPCSAILSFHTLKARRFRAFVKPENLTRTRRQGARFVFARCDSDSGSSLPQPRRQARCLRGSWF